LSAIAGSATGAGWTAGERKTLLAIAAAHAISHLHILVFPSLFPLLRTELGVGFMELGLAVTMFNLVSGLTQAPMGFLVDRVGARRVLAGGIALGSAAFAAFALGGSYG
jgi:MFS family permease